MCGANHLFVTVFLVLFVQVFTSPYETYNEEPGHNFHPNRYSESLNSPKSDVNKDESNHEFWHNKGRDTAEKKARESLNTNRAKNVIVFLGDGMSISTLAAARTYLGQKMGKTGEETELSFEKFPVTGLAKTYCVDAQVADSACSVTAYLGGVKANEGTIGVNGRVPRGNCRLMQDRSTHVHSLAKMFMKKGAGAGFVTTTSVTDASPAGVFAHTAERTWEADCDVIKDGEDPKLCTDIAYQLMREDPGKDLKVILGGGRSSFLANTTIDEEGYRGRRCDDRDLIQEWKDHKKFADQEFEYVWNKQELLTVNESTGYLLGLFEGGHCKYQLEADEMEPSFADMVQAAIKILSKSNNGYFLFAEGGRIDHAHHDSFARLALDETVEFSKGIELAVNMTDRHDTLIIVTSDHAHTMTLGGYPQRGSDILGTTGKIADDNLPVLTLSYANGPGYRKEVNGSRVDVTLEDMKSLKFRYPGTVPSSSESHAGDDVAVFALGPWQHLFTGVYEQSNIPHLITYASCLNPDLPCASSAVKSTKNLSTTLTLASFFILMYKISH